MRILIADDDIVARKLIQSALMRDGHEVETFEDGQALWEAFEATPAPIVVTDWMMPRMSGVELCQRIRREKGIEYVHVLLVTSLSPGEHTLEAYRAGVDDFIGKPFTADEVSQRVASAMRAKCAQQEVALRDALEISQRALGPDHAALLEPLNALAQITRQQRCFARCRSFIRRQHAIAAEAFGASDPRTLKLADELEQLAAIEDGLG